MGAAAGPKTVLNGITSLLDAGSPKNYNAGISTNWTNKFGGNNGTLVGGIYHNDGPFVGAGYVEFDGTSDYLDIASSTDFAFGTGDFTIEVWVYLKANSVGVIYSNEVANSFFLYLDSGNLVVRNYGTSNLFNLTGPSLNTWTHIALSRSGTDLRLFFNGVQQGSTVTNSTNWTQNGTDIGAFDNGTQSLNGYMSNFRVVKGTALYTSNFTVPTKPLTAVPNTVLLTCQGNTIADASSSGHTINVNDDAAARLGFPASAFEFDGTDDQINCGSSDDFAFGTGDFTIEFWCNPDTLATNAMLSISSNGATSTTNWQFRYDSSKVKWIYSQTANITSSSTVSAGEWTQVVATRSGTALTLYINAVSEGTASSSADLSTNGILRIGCTRNQGNFFDGKISNVKLYKGKGLTAAEVLQNYNSLKGRYVN